MGTRHLTVVKIDGEIKVAQYGQWDGYPEGQGVVILTFLKDLIKTEGLSEFKARCRSLRFATEAELKRINKDPKWSENYPELSRDAGGKILEMIAAAETELLLYNQLDFAADSLFCEFAYFIDFDAGTLEVYKGFNRTRLGKDQRFAYLEPKCDKDPETGKIKYYPVRLWHTFELSKLPSEKSFLQTCKEEE